MEFKDYYAILGVSRTATQTAIKKAYRDLARKLHPDINKEAGAEVRFKDLGEAYDVLKDPDKRTRYDRYGTAWKAAQDTPGSGNAHFDQTFDGSQFGSFFDILEHLFGSSRFGASSSAFGSGFAAGVTGSDWKSDNRDFRWGGRGGGLDQEATIRLTLEEAAAGGVKQLTKVDPDTGNRSFYTVTIPAGLEPGKRIRMAGQGGPASGVQAPGDLYLRIEIAAHKHFRLEGRDLYATVNLEPWQAALGDRMIVETLIDRIRVRVPQGTSSGDVVRVRGKGYPAHLGTGDLYITFRIVTPATLTKMQERQYQALRRESESEKLAADLKGDNP